MKKPFIIIFIILLCGCTEKQNQIKSIKILTYQRYYDDDLNSDIHLLNYSNIDGEGNVKVFNHLPLRQKSRFLAYSVNNRLLNEIANSTRSKKSINFLPKEEDFDSNRIYSGIEEQKFVLIEFESKKVISFTYHVDQQNPALKNFKILDSIFYHHKSTTRKPSNFDTLSLKNEAMDFKTYVEKIDTIKLPFQPLPPPPINAGT